jgi:hypothetical protein
MGKAAVLNVLIYLCAVTEYVVPQLVSTGHCLPAWGAVTRNKDPTR